MIVIPCRYDREVGHRPHEFPDDWEFGGPTGQDPRTDARWKPCTYFYYDADLTLLHVTQVPLCDDQALDEFTKVAGFGPKFNPRYIHVKRPGNDKPMALAWTYFKDRDELVFG